MAHFAKVVEGQVERVTVVSNEVMLDSEGIEQESLGQAFLNEHFGSANWVQCSYNYNIRGIYPSKGDYYDSVNDIFHKAQPFPSWTLNLTTGQWEAPLPLPTVSSEGLDLTPSIEGETGQDLDCRWDEAAYQADNTQGWVVLTTDNYDGDLEDTPVY